jgi:nucleotide-binding universal stress UspA family protein
MSTSAVTPDSGALPTPPAGREVSGAEAPGSGILGVASPDAAARVEGPPPPGPLFPHVLVALDRTPVGEGLLAYVPGLRALGAWKLTLVHVAGSVYLEESRNALETMAAPLRSQGFEVEVEIHVGLPAPGILAAAAGANPDLLFIGTRSHSRVRHAFLGSVALEVLEQSTRPVLLQPLAAEGPSSLPAAAGLPAGTGPTSPGLGAGRVLLATDFSAAAAPAADVVERLVAGSNVRVTLLHALEGRTSDDPARREEARLRLDGLAQRLKEAGAREVDTLLPTGHPLDVIPNAASYPDTLVVMGTHGRGFLGGLVLGSVTRKLAEASRFPLLLIPRPLGTTPATREGQS